ncbi:hypothetical protein BWQ96_08784 [Gracilariopsis chorda]|uniref:Protein kinase domain-containing protein n=1 Tax=Gracilariopsis chorda TaxID=448386 RepID=A0A2V3IHG3_9FLOR|nr:hypothetical protein BWQ96_08784 [Gracilariopsis chorda]|eukprot:PXF41502.1 hypothetical protein BWQ96_08784 [Gracilariopsis chorda]
MPATDYYIGRTVNQRWRPSALIGVGGFGWVYSAIDLSSRHGSVVIKFAEADTEEEFPDSLTCLRTEYECLRRLNRDVPHLRVPTVYEWGSYEDTDYLVMKRLGYSVDSSLFARSRPASNYSILYTCNQVFNILRRLHERNVAHGDITLKNVVFGRSGDRDNLYVIDFGSSRPADPDLVLDDVAELCHCMVLMFRNGVDGLVPDNEREGLLYDSLTAIQVQMIRRNLDRAFELRARQGTPIPQEVATIVRTVMSGNDIDHSELERLFLRALNGAST